MNTAKDQQKKEEGFTTQPVQDTAIDPKFAPLKAQPGPVVAKQMPSQEGTKAERQARKEALNK